MIAKNKLPHLFFILILVFFCFYLSKGIVFHDYDDDNWFLNILKDKTLTDYLWWRYNTWTGRVVIEALLVKTIPFHFFWKASIPASVVLFSYSVWRSFLSKTVNYNIGIPVIIIIFMLITPTVNYYASWWVTGFYNYLLPVSLASYSLMVFLHKNQSNKLEKSIAILFVSISCSSEQVSMIFVVIAILLMANRKNIDLYDIAFVTASIVFSCILFLAPGNLARLTAETLNVLPEYGNYSFIHKIALGVDVFNDHFNDKTNPLILLSLITLLLSIILTKKNHPPILSVVTKAIVVFILSIKITSILIPQNGISFYVGTLCPSNWYLPGIYISFAISLIVILAMIYGSIYIAENKNEAIYLPLIIVFALASIVALGLSSTVYASRPRVFFVFDICFLIFICCALQCLMIKLCNTQLIKKHSNDQK